MPPSPPTDSSPARDRQTAPAMLAPFAVVVACFVGSNVVAQRTAAAIDQASRGITQDAAPSIESIAAARGALRSVEELLAESVDDPGTDRRGAIRAARREVDDNLRRYLALPAFPGERALWRDVASELARFDRALDAMAHCTDAGDVPCVRALLHGEMRAATDRTDDAALRVIAFNASHAHDLAQRIEALRVRSTRIAWTLDASSAVLAAVTAWLALRSARRYGRLLEAHRALAERRADEFEQFASRVAHDILGPLTTVGLALQLVERRDGFDDRLRRTVQGAVASVRRVTAIVDGLLDFARAGASPAGDGRADVAAVLDDVVGSLQPMATERTVDLALEPVAPCLVVCSDGVLTSLVSNLVRNALKYAGGEAGRRVRVRALGDARRVRVEVEDNGPGVPHALAATIFEPYVRARDTNQPGIGLGLATVLKLARSHGGDAGLRPAAAGTGSVFWFELPRAASVERPRENAPRPLEAPGPH